MTNTPSAAPSAQAVLLRGVNVGGVTVKSALLKSTLLGIDGVETARTVAASGNVLVTGSLSDAELKSATEAALRRAFDYDASVVVVGRERLAELVAANPYPADSETVHAYITLSSDPAVLDGVEERADRMVEQNKTEMGPRTRLAPGALAWQAAVGTSTTAPMAALMASPALATTTTTRNVRTLARLLALEV